MNILGIETSCDETAAAIVNSDRKILANIIHSQQDHTPYGGVVPELASRAHIKFLDGIIQKALDEAKLDWHEIDGIAVTAGPGLIGGVIVGVMEAKAIASALKKPFIAVNHLEGHALTARLTDNVEFPYLLLLVSGGHCQILNVNGVGDYDLLGETIDDAIGESFDKLAKMLGLGMPGGPLVEKLALKGNPDAFELPKPLCERPGCDFSLSGLKTAVKKKVDSGEFSPEDICAVFQKTIGDIIENRLENAFAAEAPLPEGGVGGGFGGTLVVAGGVAANKYLRSRIANPDPQLTVIAPPINLCTDNAAMIAWAGIEKMQNGEPDSLDFKPLARWALTAQG